MKMKKDNLFGEAIYIDILIAFLIILIAFLSSCTTQRKATKYFNQHGFEAAKYCAAAFPIRDSTIYIPGETVVKSDTVTIEGDSVPCPILPGQIDTFFVKCPPSQIIHDTIFRTDTVKVIKENTAKDTIIAGLNNKISIQKEKTEVAQQKATHRGKLMWGTWILLALIICGYFFLKSRTALISNIIKKLKP